MKQWYEKGKGHVIGNGKQTRFWKDVWFEDCPLKISYPRLFNMCHDQDISVHTAGVLEWNLSYRRCFGCVEMVEWNELMTKLEEILLTVSDDRVV